MIELKIVPCITTDLKKFDVKYGTEFIGQNMGVHEVAALVSGIKKFMAGQNYLEVARTEYPTGGFVVRFNRMEIVQPYFDSAKLMNPEGQ